jgi:N-sulfoglucosamine sulfohydrolase
MGWDGDKLKLPSFLHDAPEVRQEWAEYYQSVSRLDHGVGLLMQVLRETNTLDDTLVIFLSDNGPPFPGAKTTLYDPGIHLPLMIKVPGQSTGTHSTTLASFTDIAPTILEWTGVAKPKNLVGRSLLGAKNSQESASPTEVFASHQFHEVTMYYPMRMIRTRTHKLILNLASALEFPHASDLWNSPTWQGVLKRKAQLIGQRQVSAFLNRPQFELYDLTKDPGELHNIAEKEPELRQELLVKLKDWQEATNDPWLVKYVHE